MFLALFSIIVVATCLATYRQPAVAVGYALCSFALEQWFQSKDLFFIVNGVYANVCMALIIAVGLLSSMIKGRFSFDNFSNHAAALSVYLLAFASLAWTSMFAVAWQNIVTVAPYLLLYVFVAPFLICSVDDAHTALKAVIAIGAPLVVLLLFWANWEYRNLVMPIQIMGAKFNPLALAEMAGFVALCALFAPIVLKKNLLASGLKWLVVAGALIIILKTQSRGQFIIVLLIAATFVFLNNEQMRAKHVFVGLFASIFILVFAYYALIELGTEGRWDADRLDSDFSGRFYAATLLLDHWTDSVGSILFGLGISASYSEDIFGYYVHIVPLEILGEYGLLGFSIFLVLVWIAIVGFKHCFVLTRGDLKQRGVLISFFSMFLMMLMLSFKQGSLLGSSTLFMLLAINLKLHKIVMADQREHTTSEPKNSPREQPAMFNLL